MQNLDLKNFVDINIISHEPSTVEHMRDTVVLFTSETAHERPEKEKEKGTINLDGNNYNYNIVNKTNYNNCYPNSQTYSTLNTYNYLKIFFDNGGLKVCVIEIGSTSLSREMIDELDNKYILISQVNTNLLTDTVYDNLKSIAISRNTDSSIYGINEKIIITGLYTSSVDMDSVKNFAVKYTRVQGAEMTIAAYLCKINVRGNNTVYDYSFTLENINEILDINNDTYLLLMTGNYNLDIELANFMRNVGGNCKDGSDLTNTYVKIILHQTLTDSLINLLTEKLKNSSGLAKIYTTISEELEKYLDCGYLTTDKVWTDENLIITRNAIDYTIIEKGTPLLKGYSITVLPLSSLTPEEKVIHSTPPIYIILADQYGIRKITINGEVI